MEIDESCGNGAIFLSLLLLPSIIYNKCLAAVDVLFFTSPWFHIQNGNSCFVYFEIFPKILIVLKTMKSVLSKSMDYNITEFPVNVCHICAHRSRWWLIAFWFFIGGHWSGKDVFCWLPSRRKKSAKNRRFLYWILIRLNLPPIGEENYEYCMEPQGWFCVLRSLDGYWTDKRTKGGTH